MSVVDDHILELLEDFSSNKILMILLLNSMS